MARTADRAQADILLRGGTIVDGTGAASFAGDLLIRAGRIRRISRARIRTTGISIDCAGRIVAPGFIDAHSHMDWRLPIKGHDEMKWPFIAQGITTFIGGNCGTAAAGFREGSTFTAQVADTPLKSPLLKMGWATVRDYFTSLASMGTSHNLALLAGHGTVRASIRGMDPSPLHPYESAEMLRLMDSAMEQGARGVSLGLQSEPGMFARPEELREVALAVKRRGKVLSVHARALSALSGAYPVRSFGRPHNLVALEEILELARRTGVRLEISHLVFVGTRTWKTAEEALGMIEKAAGHGVDVRFDVLPFPCGAVRISLLLPSWFMARLPQAWEEAASLRRLHRELAQVQRLIGFGAADVQLADAVDPDLKRFDGMFLSEIARQRRLRAEGVLAEIARKSGGRAVVLCHRCSSPAIVDALIRHPRSLFMTGAWVDASVVHNPAAFGSFPRVLQLVRDKRLLRLEEAVHKMTGATAERFGITDRGTLAEGKAADITVFDGEAVRDSTTPQEADAPPAGIEYVFVNGRKVMSGGKKESPLNAGVPLPG